MSDRVILREKNCSENYFKNLKILLSIQVLLLSTIKFTRFEIFISKHTTICYGNY